MIRCAHFGHNIVTLNKSQTRLIVCQCLNRWSIFRIYKLSFILCIQNHTTSHSKLITKPIFGFGRAFALLIIILNCIFCELTTICDYIDIKFRSILKVLIKLTFWTICSYTYPLYLILCIRTSLMRKLLFEILVIESLYFELQSFDITFLMFDIIIYKNCFKLALVQRV